jgi:hypothetical protein
MPSSSLKPMGLRAYRDRDPLTIVQGDAQVDLGDVIKGNPIGYCSTMRRAAEKPWVTSMVQVGIDGLVNRSFVRPIRRTRCIAKLACSVCNAGLSSACTVAPLATRSWVAATVLKAEFRTSEDQALRVMMTAHRAGGACVVAV